MDGVKVYIVDDHQLIIDGIESMIDSLDGWEVIGFANDGEEACLKIPILKPDLVIMDLDMPTMNGLKASSTLLNENPLLKIIILTLHYEKSIVQKLVSVGVSGYMLKNTPKKEFVKGLEMVYSGNKFFSSQLMENMLETSPINVSNKSNVKLMAMLTEREQEVLQLVAEGESSKVMAETLNLSIKTIESHRKSLLQKLGAKNSAQLIRIAVKEGFIDF